VSDTYPDDRTDPDAIRITVTVTAGGVAVRTTEKGGVHLVTAKQAAVLAGLVRDAGRWMVGPRIGGAKLSARVLDSCVIVRCAGFASAAECEAFAGELERVAGLAMRWVKPELDRWGKRKHKPEGVTT